MTKLTLPFRYGEYHILSNYIIQLRKIYLKLYSSNIVTSSIHNSIYPLSKNHSQKNLNLFTKLQVCIGLRIQLRVSRWRCVTRSHNERVAPRTSKHFSPPSNHNRKNNLRRHDPSTLSSTLSSPHPESLLTREFVAGRPDQCRPRKALPPQSEAPGP